MLREILGRVLKRAIKGQPFDPSTLNDPVANITGWTPISGAGSNFCTHKLVAVSTIRLEFKVTVGMILFCLVFVVVGCSMVAYFIIKIYPHDYAGLMTEDSLLPLAGVAFFGLGSYMLYSDQLPIVFDKNEESFWKGRISPGAAYDKGSLEAYSALDNIHALQIVSELEVGNKTSYFSYELNIVLKDGHRINVVDHGNLTRIKKDAAALGKFLKIPVWLAC